MYYLVRNQLLLRYNYLVHSKEYTCIIAECLDMAEEMVLQSVAPDVLQIWAAMHSENHNILAIWYTVWKIICNLLENTKYAKKYNLQAKFEVKWDFLILIFVYSSDVRPVKVLSAVLILDLANGPV